MCITRVLLVFQSQEHIAFSLGIPSSTLRRWRKEPLNSSYLERSLPATTLPVWYYIERELYVSHGFSDLCFIKQCFVSSFGLYVAWYSGHVFVFQYFSGALSCPLFERNTACLNLGTEHKQHEQKLNSTARAYAVLWLYWSQYGNALRLYTCFILHVEINRQKCSSDSKKT